MESVPRPADADPADVGPVACGRALLDALRSGADPTPFRERLAAYDEAALEPLRADDDRALSFWLNCYNAGTQLLLDERPDLYESPLRFVRFFGATCLTVGGTDLTLSDVEHGILRGSQWQLGLGYVRWPFPGAFERRYRFAEADPRIHFALNCGAASCPAIRTFDPDRVDEQLDRATRVYLDGEAEYDPDGDTVRLPRVFLWYRGDFGGRSGIRAFLREYDAVPEDASPSLRYDSWDWEMAPGKYVE